MPLPEQGIGALTAGAATAAQNYPYKPIRIVVPGTGGGTDLMARLIARHGAHGMEHQFRAAQTICEALTRAGAEFRKTQFIKCGAALLATMPFMPIPASVRPRCRV